MIERGAPSLPLALGLGLLALVGHAAAFQLIDVRPYAAYQHYVPWRVIATGRPWGAWVLLAQTMVVATLFWRVRHSLRATIVAWPSVPRTLLMLALAGFSLAVPTESVARFFGEVALAGGIALVSLLNLVLVALALPETVATRVAGWLDARVTLGRHTSPTRPWDRVLPIAVAAWVVCWPPWPAISYSNGSRTSTTACRICFTRSILRPGV